MLAQIDEVAEARAEEAARARARESALQAEHERCREAVRAAERRAAAAENEAAALRASPTQKPAQSDSSAWIRALARDGARWRCSRVARVS